MSNNLKKVLHHKDGLEITFLVEQGEARVEFQSDGENYDLSDPDDVILFVNGDPVPAESTDAHAATARIGPWDAYEGEVVSMMVRVDEYFDGWDVEA